MKIRSLDQRRHVLGIAESFERLVPDVDRMLDGFVPVGILVDDGGHDFLQMKLIMVADKGAQQAVAAVGLDAVLIIFGAEREV